MKLRVEWPQEEGILLAAQSGMVRWDVPVSRAPWQVSTQRPRLTPFNLIAVMLREKNLGETTGCQVMVLLRS